MLAAFIFLISTTFAIIWSILFLPLNFINLKIYKISGKRMNIFLKKVKLASIWTNDDPDGWIFGKYYVGYIHTVTGNQQSEGETKDLYILCSNDFYKNNIELKETNEEGRSSNITYYEREGSYWRLMYNPRPINFPKKPIRENQAKAVKSILDIFNSKDYVISLLHGRAGTGKSMTAQYLCQELLNTKKSVSFVDSFNPFEYGDNFVNLYTRINPTQDKPLVLMLEEIDENIVKMHSGKIEQKLEMPIPIKNKSDWNSFLDKFDRELYPHIILIMTTNKNKEFFDELDPSYMRLGRVDIKIEF